MEIFKFNLTPMTELYYSEDSLYGVYRFNTEEELPNTATSRNIDNKLLHVSNLVGKMQRLSIGAEYECEAKMSFNNKYNNYQYEVVSIKLSKPDTLEKQKAFLKCIITEKQTEALLEAYPNIIELVMEDKPVDLSKVKGIKDKTFEKIKDKIVENYVLADILTFLKPLGITMTMIKKLKEYEPNTVLLKQLLKDNPYILTKIRGLGFAKVDKLALEINPRLRVSEHRTKSFIIDYLSGIAENEGNTKIKASELDIAVKTKIKECLSIYQGILEKELRHETFLHIDGGDIGLLYYYKREAEIFQILKDLEEAKSFTITEKAIEQAYELFKKENGYELTDEQREPVVNLNTNNVQLVVGKAGVGKTSIIKAVIKAVPNKKVSLCALSAKASQRMFESTGIEASTIHRLLGFMGGEFLHNEKSPLSSDVIIVDEASMINSSILLSLLKAVKKGAKLILVFDNGQLPPIGAGNVASDLLESKFKITYLTKVHRTASDSGILSDANTIREGKNPIVQPSRMEIRGNLKDMYYAFRSEKEDVFETTISYYMRSLNNINVDDICICVPRKKDTINSASEYNNKIQDLLLGNEEQCIKKGFKLFKLGAKLIQKVNNYDKCVVNGEIGYLTYINNNNKIFKVDFGEKTVEYTFEEMDELELAYALTVHSTQGSQYHTVLVPLDMASYILLSKELIYTAITRASKRCMVIAVPKAFSIGIKTNASKRNTFLQKIIKNDK